MRPLCMAIFVVLFVGFQFPSSETSLLAAEYSRPQGWDQLVQAARKEGIVSIYGRTGEQTEELLGDFEKAYPGIKIIRLSLPGAALLSRLMSEYRARKHLADVLLGTSAAAILKPAGLLASLKPSLILPEVTDASAWRNNRLWWYDTFEPHTTLNFQGIAQPDLTYNTNLVNPNDLASWMDLLNTKWKGKLVSADPRRHRFGGAPIMFAYQHPSLGPRYLKRFFGEMDVTLSASSRQMVDWVGRGRFHLALGVGVLTTLRAADQGLPVALLATQRFKEGSRMTASGGAITLMQRMPHPNAAKLFVNWLLSRQGQMAWQKRTKQNSLRIDVPKDGLALESTPIPGQKYIFMSTEEQFRARDSILASIKRIMKQSGR